MAYTPLKEFKSLGALPLVINTPDKSAIYSLPTSVIPPTAKEVLLYLFVTVRDAGIPQDVRVVYEIYTEDGDGNKYSQFMNAIFTASKDFVMNSANLWFPLFPGKHDIKIRLPYAGVFDNLTEDLMKRLESNAATEKKFENFDEAMKHYIIQDKPVYSEVFVLGYR